MTPSNYEEDSNDDYPYYRGMKLSFLPGNPGRIYWRTAREEGIEINAVSGHEEVLAKLLSIRPEGGSFRITELGEVLVKVAGESGDKPEIPRYVCKLKKKLEFDGDVDNRPKGVKPGDLWEGMYDGTRFSFVPSASGEQKAWWSTVEDFSVRYQLLSKMPRKVLLDLTARKPTGGRFCVTPDGYVLTLVEKGVLDESARLRYKELYDEERFDPLRLIDSKERRTGLFPVFIGIWEIDPASFEFKRPRKWGEELRGEERNRMLENITGLLNEDPIGMVVPVDVPDDEPEFLYEDAIATEDDPEIALLMSQEDE